MGMFSRTNGGLVSGLGDAEVIDPVGNELTGKINIGWISGNGTSVFTGK